MSLILQIKALAFSFIYGIFFAFTYKMNYKYLTTKNLFFKIVISFLFILDHVLLYFSLLTLINNAMLHFYFFISFIIGIIFYRYFFDN